MRKRLVYRADDVGYTEAFDLGIYKAFEEGIATSADVMLDSQHVTTALQWLKERPWVSVGWHRHLGERPVLPPEEVPSLVNEEGRFKWGHRKAYLMEEATYEDAYKEFMAEAELCKEYLGHYPDVAGVRVSELPLEKAYADVVNELGIVTNYFTTAPRRIPAAHGRQPMIKKARGNTVVLTQTRRRLQTASIE